jgi:hypothetical protein
MYLVIDFATYEVNLQPTQTIISIDNFSTLESAQQHIEETVKLNHEILSQLEYDNDDITTHTLMAFELNDNFTVFFNPLTSHYISKEHCVSMSEYQSLDF